VTTPRRAVAAPLLAATIPPSELGDQPPPPEALSAPAELRDGWEVFGESTAPPFTAPLPEGPLGATPSAVQGWTLRKVIVLLSISLAGALGLLIARPWETSKSEVPRPAEPLGPIETTVPRWKGSIKDLEGSAAFHQKRGEVQLELDTPAGYAIAVEEFRRSLVLDPKNDRAVAGYVQALALGKGPRIEEDQFQEALLLIVATMEEESSPPLKQLPMGTSPTSWLRTAFTNRRSKRVLSSSSLSISAAPSNFGCQYRSILTSPPW
jgi:hypothetical protein